MCEASLFKICQLVLTKGSVWEELLKEIVDVGSGEGIEADSLKVSRNHTGIRVFDLTIL